MKNKRDKADGAIGNEAQLIASAGLLLAIETSEMHYAFLDWRASAGAMVLAQGSTLVLVGLWSGGEAPRFSSLRI